MKAYTLKKHTTTNELHLFEGEMTTEQKCTSNGKSICKGMNKEESINNTFTCKNEVEARIECAKIGRSICGKCVSHLYTTY